MNGLILPAGGLPQVALAADVAARLQAQMQEAVANLSSSLPRISFGGREFHISVGNDSVVTSEKVLDIHIVAVNPKQHYTFYEREYTGTDVDKEGHVLSRYPTPDDPIEFVPTAEFKQRVYRQRCVVMLANDPEHTLYVMDLGYKSIRKTGNPAVGLFNLSQLLTQLQSFQKAQPTLYHFMFTVQMSFAVSSVPEVQFSLFDQRNPSDRTVRFASPQAISRMVEVISGDELEPYLNIEFDSRATSDSGSQRSVSSEVAQVIQRAKQQPVQQVPQMESPVAL